ncbi:MAG: glutathione S-transferase N-terminal domain-containing protein [Deltaproteobacteria bacterium]|nr:glutathione S-transferase N-terminal domain-containing protein [Deltaproteobacteria bacterium]
MPPALRRLTALGRVPALQHGDFWLTESLAIVEYLEEIFPPPHYPPLFPADPRGRARTRQILAYLRADLRALRDERPWRLTIWPASPPPLSATATRDARALLEFVEHLQTTGELATWSIAHADIAFTLQRLIQTDHTLTDAVRRFYEITVARPSVRAYLEHPRPPNPPP